MEDPVKTAFENAVTVDGGFDLVSTVSANGANWETMLDAHRTAVALVKAEAEMQLQSGAVQITDPARRIHILAEAVEFIFASSNSNGMGEPEKPYISPYTQSLADADKAIADAMASGDPSAVVKAVTIKAQLEASPPKEDAPLIAAETINPLGV